MGYAKDDPHFRKLYENTVMLVGHVFESAYCYDKLAREEFGIYQFIHDPTCAVVGRKNDWCLIGGEDLILRTWFDKTLRRIDSLKAIHDLKLIDDYKVQILVDPWSEEASIWQLEIDLNNPAKAITFFKVRDFKEYLGRPYVEKVHW